ncbi:DUF6087 family protein [Streptomyces uncialis]|uniref:DUF6087 family protein n=1 Tax=Streptomyces uncialis TaxID=1048205 RepID=UPI00386F2A2F|nr:DUF6087 family protein [Streptomyces uncialis]
MRRVRRAAPPADEHLPAPAAGARRRSHLRPDEPRVLEEWSGFAYEPAGTAPGLAAAQE